MSKNRKQRTERKANHVAGRTELRSQKDIKQTMKAKIKDGGRRTLMRQVRKLVQKLNVKLKKKTDHRSQIKTQTTYKSRKTIKVKTKEGERQTYDESKEINRRKYK